MQHIQVLQLHDCGQQSGIARLHFLNQVSTGGLQVAFEHANCIFCVHFVACVLVTNVTAHRGRLRPSGLTGLDDI